MRGIYIRGLKGEGRGAGVYKAFDCTSHMLRYGCVPKDNFIYVHLYFCIKIHKCYVKTKR